MSINFAKCIIENSDIFIDLNLMIIKENGKVTALEF
jgi:hypothetical protein